MRVVDVVAGFLYKTPNLSSIKVPDFRGAPLACVKLCSIAIREFVQFHFKPIDFGITQSPDRTGMFSVLFKYYLKFNRNVSVVHLVTSDLVVDKLFFDLCKLNTGEFFFYI